MARAKLDEHLRNQRSVARRYRKLGYAVTERPAAEQLPAFLHGFSPALVATRDDDHVVIEIKRRDELKGSNEFVALAAAVEKQSGWRLELIYLGSLKPNFVGADKEILDRLVARSLSVQEAGLLDAALLYALSVLEELIRDVGARHGIKVLQLSTRAIVRELAFLGVVGEETVDALDRAWEQRDRIMHEGGGGDGADASAVTELIAACREIQEATQLEAA